MIDTPTRLLLQDILSNARIALEQIQGKSAGEFAASVTLLYAATHAVEIVGEAASKVDPAVRNAMPSIPWRHAIGIRNKLIHGYRTVLPHVVYETGRDDFPPLIAEIEHILNDGN